MLRIAILSCLIFIINPVFASFEYADKDKGVIEIYEISEIQAKKADLKLEISQYESAIEQAEKDRIEAIDKIAKAQEDIQKGTLNKEAIESELKNAEEAKSKAENDIVVAEDEIKKLEIKIAKFDETIINEGINENEVGENIEKSLTSLKGIQLELQNVETVVNTAEADKEKVEEEKKEEEAKAKAEVFVFYPDCKSITYAFPDWARCPSGYYELWCINRRAPDSCCDALRLCEKPSVGSDECAIGYYVVGLDHSNMGKDGVVPKRMNGYIRILASWRGVQINMINEATGERRTITGNYDIPYSTTHDQKIRFIGGYGDGIIVLYVGGKYADEEATIAAQQEARLAIERLEIKIGEVEKTVQQVQEDKKQLEIEIKKIEDEIMNLRSAEQDIIKRKEDAVESKSEAELTKNQKIEDKERFLTKKEELIKILEEKVATLEKLGYEIAKVEYEKKHEDENIKQLDSQIETLKNKKENLEKELQLASVELNKLRGDEDSKEEL